MNLDLNCIARLYRALYITIWFWTQLLFVTTKCSRISTLIWKFTVIYKILWKGELEVSLISREPRICTHLTPPDPSVCVPYHPQGTHWHPKCYTACILLCIIYLFGSYCCYHICSIMFDAFLIIIFYSIVFIIFFCLFVFYLLLICFALTYSELPHSILLMIAIFPYSVQLWKQCPLVHQLLPLYHLFRRNLALY